MNSRRLAVGMPLLMLSTIAAAQPAQQPESPDPLAVDIDAVMLRLAEEMDKEFISDPRLRGLPGRSSTADDDADFDTFLGILRTLGYATIEVGDQIRIVPEQVARTEPTLLLQGDDNRVSDHAIVTRVIDVSDIELAPGVTAEPGIGGQLVPVLRPMMSTQIGQIAAVPGTSKLILVDRYDNIRRITAVIDELRR